MLVTQQPKQPQRRGQELNDKIGKLSKEDVERLIDSYIIGRNAERNRKILKRKLIDGITYEDLTTEFDLSDKQLKNIVYKGKEKMISKLH